MWQRGLCTLQAPPLLVLLLWSSMFFTLTIFDDGGGAQPGVSTRLLEPTDEDLPPCFENSRFCCHRECQSCTNRYAKIEREEEEENPAISLMAQPGVADVGEVLDDLPADFHQPRYGEWCTIPGFASNLARVSSTGWTLVRGHVSTR